VEASARTTSASEFAEHPAASGALLTTEALFTNDQKVETVPTQPVPAEAVAQPVQTQALAQMETAAARTDAALPDSGVAAVQQADSAPLSIALLEDMADLHAPVQKSPNWRRKNGYGAVPTNSAHEGSEAAARNGSTWNGSAGNGSALNGSGGTEPTWNNSTGAEPPVVESAAKKEEPLDAPEAMKLLASPVAIPQPAPLAGVPAAPVVAGPFTPQQAQDAAAALQNLSSGVAESALVVPPAQREAVAGVQPEATELEEAAPASSEENHASAEASVAALTPPPAAEHPKSASESASESSSESASESVSDSGPALVPEILDAKAAAEKSIGARAADLLARLNTSREDTERVSRSIRTKTVESRAVETREVETREVDSQPVEAHELNGKTLYGQPLSGKTVDATPVNAQPVAPAAKSDVAPKSGLDATSGINVKSGLNEATAVPATWESAQTNAPVAAPKDIAPASPAPEAPPAPQVKTGKFGRLLRMATEGHKPATGSQTSKLNQPVSAALPAPAASSNPIAAASNPEAASSDQVASVSNPVATAPYSDVVAHSPDAASPSAVPSNPVAADVAIAPFDPTARQLPLPLRPAPISPAPVSSASTSTTTIAALGAEPKDSKSGEEAATKADATAVSNLPFSENAPLLANKLRQAPTEPALVDQKLPLAQPTARNMVVSFAPAVAIPLSAGSVRPPRSKVDSPTPRYGRLVRNPAIAKSALRVAAPPRDAITTPPAPSLTLPGPMLTPSLVAFRDKELVPKFIGFGPQKKRWGNAWLFVALLGGTTLGVGLTGLLSNLPRPEPSFKEAAKDAPAPAENAANATAVTAPATAAKPATHLIPKSIELSGFRIVGDPNNGGEQVRFTVVNHGPTRFTDGVVYVALRAANARPGQPPLYRFTFPAPNLAPYEAREMSSVVKKASNDASLPGWQDLRADVEVGQP
jgi:hypothetical protein